MHPLLRKIRPYAGYSLIAPLFVISRVAYAQTINASTSTISDYLIAFQNFLNGLIPIIIGLALVGVLWGLAIYAFKAGDEGEQERGRRIMFWGIIVLFVMVSIWGFVAVLQSTIFGPGSESTITTPPDLPTLEE